MVFVNVKIEAARGELFATMWTNFLRRAVGLILVFVAFVSLERSLIFKSTGMANNSLLF